MVLNTVGMYLLSGAQIEMGVALRQVSEDNGRVSLRIVTRSKHHLRQDKEKSSVSEIHATSLKSETHGESEI